MTKKLIILAYIMGVLLLSGMVKANDIIGHGLVVQVSVNDASGILNVSGNYPTPCHSKATVVVSNIDDTKHVLHLTVETRVPGDAICAAVVSKPFSISYDLKELPLQAGSTYRIDFGSSMLKDVIQYKALAATGNLDYKLNKQDYKGFLIYLSQTNENNEGFALRKGNQIVQLVSPDMTPELKKYVNQEVRITGYPVETASITNPIQDTLAQSSQSNDNVMNGELSTTVIVPVSVGL